MTSGGADSLPLVPPVPDDLLVIRFSPFSVDGLLRNAETTYRDDKLHGREPRRGVSVYAESPQEGESVDETIARVCRGAPVGGKTISTVLASVLVEAGLPVVVDEPPAHHHLVMLQDDGADADADRLHGLLQVARRRNPAWGARP